MRLIAFSFISMLSVLNCATVSPRSKTFTAAQKANTPVVEASATPIQESGLPKGSNPRLNLDLTASKPPKADPASVIRKSQEEARKNPESHGYYNAAMVYDFEPNKLYQVYTAPLRVTDIVLEPSEKITALSGGDTIRWEVTQTGSGSGIDSKSHVLVKPRQSDLKTNLIILTDRRTYHLEIHSSANDAYMASLSWNYPRPLVVFEQTEAEPSSNPMDGLKPETLNFNYHFVTDRKPSWMPVRAFDDGQKTYVQFDPSRQSRDAPGLFVLSNTGKSEIANYRSSGDYYIIDRLVDIVELRLGTEDPEIVGIERL